MDDYVKDAKNYCLNLAQKYTGKLGKKLLIQMMLSIEKLILAENFSDQKIKNATLIGCYFHDIGRTLSDSDDHPELSFEIFKKYSQNKSFSEDEIKVIKDCCLNHGSSSSPVTHSGQLMKLFDKSVVFEPEIMMVVLEKLVLSYGDWHTAYSKFIEKMEKWNSKIDSEKVKTKNSSTIKRLKSIIRDE
ncbi:MAG: hypothetical protein ACQESF_07060 [Nanobdellota archaeon]